MKRGTSYGVAADGEIYLYGMIEEEAIKFVDQHPDFCILRVHNSGDKKKGTWTPQTGIKRSDWDLYKSKSKLTWERLSQYEVKELRKEYERSDCLQTNVC